MNGVECVDQDFKLNSLRYWKPMKVFENRRNMVKSMSLGNDSCCKVLNFLKSVLTMKSFIFNLLSKIQPRFVTDWLEVTEALPTLTDTDLR